MNDVISSGETAAHEANLVQIIARFTHRLESSSLSGNERAILKHAIMDCLAASFAGVGEPVTGVALSLGKQYCGVGSDASLIGDRMKCSPVGAAFVNGTMAHACDYDDVSETMCGHPSAPSLPAILALAESRRSSGREVLAAFAAAMEAMMKLGRIGGLAMFRSGWHPTAILGVFGATIGCCRILRLNEVETARAIGVAASRAAGLRCNVGTMVKPLHSGFAARDGLEAALLAQAGATASIDSLEGPFGLFPVLAAGRNPSAGFEQTLGNPFDFIQPGIIFKKYPSCLDTHAAIDAALAIRAERRVHTGEVARIICSLPPGIGDDLVYADPKTLLEGKFSLEFCVALALVRGRVTTTEFADKAIDDPDIREMMRATIVRHDPQLILPEGSFCGSARVEILTRDGGRISKYVEYMSGHPRNPMDASQLRQKLYDCAGAILPEDRIRHLVAMIEDFEQIDDVSVFCRLLATD